MTSTSRPAFLRPHESVFVQILRYGATGLVAFLVDFGILVFLAEKAGIHYMFSACWGFLGGLTANYLLSIRWVFSNRTMDNSRTEFLVFALVGLGGLLLTEVILWTGTEAVLLDYRVSKIIAVALVLCWNFGLRKYLLFRNPTSD